MPPIAAVGSWVAPIWASMWTAAATSNRTEYAYLALGSRPQSVPPLGMVVIPCETAGVAVGEVCTQRMRT